MTDETIPLDAYCKNCKYYINFTNPAWRICVAPKIVKNGFMVHVDDNHVCRDWKVRGEEERANLKSTSHELFGMKTHMKWLML